MIYFFNCCVILWDDVTKFIWQRSHIPPEFIEISITGSRVALGKISENLFCILIISQDWRYYVSLSQGDPQGFSKRCLFCTLAIMSQSYLPRQWHSPWWWHFTLSCFTTFSCLLLSGASFAPTCLDSHSTTRKSFLL